MILVIGGLDCSGSAGLSVDLKVCQVNHLHAFPIVSTHTVQTVDTGYACEALKVEIFSQQLKTLFNDERLLAEIKGIKIGLFCNSTLMQVFCDEIESRRESYFSKIPIILDPVIQASSGLEFVQANQQIKYLNALNRLLSYVSCITPNQSEWQLIQSWLEQGYIKPKPDLYTLVSTMSIKDKQIQSELLSPENFVCVNSWQQSQIFGTFRGTGCALATAIACAVVSIADIHNTQDRLIQAISIAFKQLQGWLNQSIKHPVLRNENGTSSSPYLLRIE